VQDEEPDHADGRYPRAPPRAHLVHSRGPAEGVILAPSSSSVKIALNEVLNGPDSIEEWEPHTAFGRLQQGD